MGPSALKESSPLPAPRTAAVGGDAQADGEEPLPLLAATILRSGITASDSSIRPRGCERMHLRTALPLNTMARQEGRKDI